MSLSRKFYSDRKEQKSVRWVIYPKILKKIYISLYVLFLIICASAMFSMIDYGEFQSLREISGLYQFRGLIHAAVYSTIYVLSIGSLIVAFGNRSRILRIAFATAFCLSTAIAYFVRCAYSEPLSLAQLMIAKEATNGASAFVMNYYKDFLVSLAISGGAYALLYFATRLSLRSVSPLAAISVAPAFAAVFAVVWHTNGALGGFPSGLSTPALMLDASLRPALYAGSRDRAPGLAGNGDVDAKLIVFIMDESIQGQYLSLNGYSKDTTPVLVAHPDEYTNLGIACSAGNHSALSNFIIQTGLQPEQLPDAKQIGLKLPTLFAFAKQRGYYTVYADAQVGPFSYSNFMRSSDFNSVDETVKLTQEKFRTYEKDREIFSRLLTLIKKHDKTFIYFIKQGAHFPYNIQYPPSEEPFRPAMRSTAVYDATDEEITNSYLDALQWSIDAPLHAFFKSIDRSAAAVIYTGDHGQSIESIRENGTHGKVTDPPVSQALVPLLAFGEPLERRLRPVLAEIVGKTSHFQLFATELILMGYDEDKIVAAYGDPLWRPYGKKRRFLSGDLFGRGRSFLNDCPD